MVTLVEEPGSMPSVLRAFFGVSISTPQAVNPLPPLYATWKLPEFFSIMRYSVKLSQRLSTIMRGQFWLPPLRASSARSHHETFLPSTLAQPRPSTVPSPITPAPDTPVPLIMARHPRPAADTMPQLPG